MSYDLDFWKYKKDTYLDNQTVYKLCSQEEQVEGLEQLPICSIIKAVQMEFDNWRMEETLMNFKNPNGKGTFEIFTTTQFVRFDCRGIDGLDMNRIIEIMVKYNCPLYDPQVPKRYDLRQIPIG